MESGPFYNKYAGQHEGKTSISYVSKSINVQEKGAVDKYFFKSRFLDDNQHTIGYFTRVAKRLGGVKGKELKRMKEMITSEEEGICSEYSNKVYYSDEVLYKALTSNPVAQKVCEKNKYDNWTDICSRID